MSVDNEFCDEIINGDETIKIIMVIMVIVLLAPGRFSLPPRQSGYIVKTLLAPARFFAVGFLGPKNPNIQ